MVANRLLKLAFFGVLALVVGVPLVAQTPTIFPSIRVNSTSDLRGAILNGTGNVLVADQFDVDVAAGTDELNITAGLVTIPGDLTISGTCTGCAAGFPLLAPAGSAAAPSYSFSADPDTGFYESGVSVMRWAVDGADQLINSAGAFFTSVTWNFQAAVTHDSTLSVNPSGGAVEFNATANLVAIGTPFDVDAGGGTDEMNVTAGLVTFPGDVTISGTCTGCSGGTTLASGNYTPTVFADANVDGAGTTSTAGPCQYLQVGTVVNVSCTATVDVTLTATFTQMGISLPVASALANGYEVAGNCVSLLSTQTQGAQVVADAANNRATMQFTAQGGTAGASWDCVFTYTVI